MQNKNRLRRELKRRSDFSRRAEIASKALVAMAPDALFRDILSGNSSLFRFFSKASHADDMCNGKLLLSTLGSCRGYEDPRRGDKGEGEHTYHFSGRGNGNDQDFVQMARRAGFRIAPQATNIQIIGTKTVSRIRDAFVVCTTVRYSPAHMTKHYGNYCVEIFNAPLFIRLVNDVVQNLGFALRPTLVGLVKYADRDYRGLGPPPGQLGFVKPRDQYSEDQECRLLWELASDIEIAKRIIHVPGLSEACRRIR